MEDCIEIQVANPLRLHERVFINGSGYVVRSIFNCYAGGTMYDVLFAQNDRSSYWGPFGRGWAVVASGQPRVKDKSYLRMEDRLTARLKLETTGAGGQN